MAKSGSPGSSTPARRDRTVASPLSSMPADASLSAVTSPRASAGSEARVAVRGGVGSSRLLTLIGLTGGHRDGARTVGEPATRRVPRQGRLDSLARGAPGRRDLGLGLRTRRHRSGRICKVAPSAFAQIRGHFAGVSEGGLEPKRDPLAFQAESVSPCNSTARLPTVVSRYLGTVPPGGAPIFSSCCRE